VRPVIGITPDLGQTSARPGRPATPQYELKQAYADAVLAAGGYGLAGCTTTPPTSASGTSENADKRRSINAGVDSTLARLYATATANGSRELVTKARGVLVFPSVIQAGFWVGGQYGEGALRVGGQTAGDYNTVGGSFGLQIGAQSKAIIFLFMTQDALDRFRNSDGWAVGADATVAVVKLSAEAVSIPAGGDLDARVLDSISPGFHINANPATFPYLIATELTTGKTAGIAVGVPVYPAAVKRKFQFEPQPLAVYEGDAPIKLSLRADKTAGAGSRSLPITVRVQACDQEKCYPPATLNSTISVTVK